MSHENKRVTVRILDKEYQVACRPEEKEALFSAARELDHRMRQVRNAGTAVLGIDRLAVMVALNLCHELQQERKKSASSASVTLPEEALERLAAKLDQAMNL